MQLLRERSDEYSSLAVKPTHHKSDEASHQESNSDIFILGVSKGKLNRREFIPGTANSTNTFLNSRIPSFILNIYPHTHRLV